MRRGFADKEAVGVQQRFVERMTDTKVRHDLGVLAGFTEIWCAAQHGDRERVAIDTDAARLGVYRAHRRLCAECREHLAYAEQRRAYCPHDPKPFCAHCETHCYRPAESAWQRQVMRYAGPRSWYRGYLLDGIRHMREGRAYRKQMTARAGASEKE